MIRTHVVHASYNGCNRFHCYRSAARARPRPRLQEAVNGIKRRLSQNRRRYTKRPTGCWTGWEVSSNHSFPVMDDGVLRMPQHWQKLAEPRERHPRRDSLGQGGVHAKQAQLINARILFHSSAPLSCPRLHVPSENNTSSPLIKKDKGSRYVTDQVCHCIEDAQKRRRFA